MCLKVSWYAIFFFQISWYSQYSWSQTLKLELTASPNILDMRELRFITAAVPIRTCQIRAVSVNWTYVRWHFIQLTVNQLTDSVSCVIGRIFQFFLQTWPNRGLALARSCPGPSPHGLRPALRPTNSQLQLSVAVIIKADAVVLIQLSPMRLRDSCLLYWHWTAWHRQKYRENRSRIWQ